MLRAHKCFSFIFLERNITLKLFNGVKDIFRNSVPVEVTRKQNFVLTPGAVTPVALYEFELQELFVEATVKSGCKWWCKNSECSHTDYSSIKNRARCKECCGKSVRIHAKRDNS
jgi:hypothetical protein